ncbi:MAG: AAA family ATPase, partial [Gemmatimonadales bacterium]
MYQLHCLGEAALRGPSGNLVHFRSRKHFALLVYLALNADRAHRRERLVHLLWSDSDPSKARHSLSQALYAVRRLLNGAVHIEGEDLEIKSEGLRVDALELERLLEAGDSEAAADLYRGEFLEGFWVRGAQGFEEWAGHERARVGALARDALRSAVKSARDRCAWVEVRRQAERLVQLDPFDEAAYAELMRALWMMNDRSAALECFQDLERVLETELHASPSKEIVGLAERIRQRPVRGSWTTRRLLRETGVPLFHDPPFVGRELELGALAQEWDRVAAGESRTVALTGAAGIGKTRLANQFIGSLALTDVTVLRGRCYEVEQTLPYGPVAEALRSEIATIELGGVNPLWLAELARIVPEVHARFDDLPQPSVLDAEGSRRRLYEGIAQVLSSACEIRPVLMFVDDAHWADDSSLALLHYLHRRVTNGLYLVTAHRPEELEPRTALATTDFLTGHSPRVRTLYLKGLGQPASSALFLSLMGERSDESARAKLLELSGGNPFFAIELVREFAESDEHPTDKGQLRIPESIKALLNRRFAGLEERSTAFLEQAACLGTRVSVEVLSSAVGLPPGEFSSQLRELSRAAILMEEEGIIRFRHNLLREVAWSRVPVVLRGALHLRASRALIKLGGSDGEIALHLLASGERLRAHRHALRGADAAEGIFALEEVAELLQLAIETAPREQTRIDLVGRLGRVYLHMRDYAKARPLLEESLEYLAKRETIDLELFEARRDLLFLDMYSSTTKVEES